MSDIIVKEAQRRGRAEAVRRDLQYRVDEAYHAEIERVEGPRRRKAEREEAARVRRARAAHVSRVFLCYAAQLGWMALCVFVAFDRSWEAVASLEDFFWQKEWIAYIGLFIVFVYGRRLLLTVCGIRES